MAMSDINDRRTWENVCEKLYEMTASGKMLWIDYSDECSRQGALSDLYTTTYKTWRFLIYRYEYKAYVDEERYNWDEDVAFEIIREDGQVDWKLPNVPCRFRLLDLIQYKKASIDQLVDDLLGDDD